MTNKTPSGAEKHHESTEPESTKTTELLLLPLLLQDILGFAFITIMLMCLRFLRVWMVAVLMVLLFFYDIFMVFITPFFTAVSTLYNRLVFGQCMSSYGSSSQFCFCHGWETISKFDLMTFMHKLCSQISLLQQSSTNTTALLSWRRRGSHHLKLKLTL